MRVKLNGGKLWDEIKILLRERDLLMLTRRTRDSFIVATNYGFIKLDGSMRDEKQKIIRYGRYAGNLPDAIGMTNKVTGTCTKIQTGLNSWN